jgi:glycosyltransferase involved in cell wall biosynthesis
LSVSILIPAFRPTFLRQAIASALAQGIDDFELLISDDSGGEELLPIVETFRDPRIRYFRTAGRTGAMENCRGLWNAARFDLLKFLFDDDLLMPHAVGELLAAVRSTPKASLAFGPRYIVDEAGRITRTPNPAYKEVTELGYQAFVNTTVGQVRNGVGELSNVLINQAAGLSFDDLAFYQGYELRVDADMGLYINAARKGVVMALPHTVGAFRRHRDQNSSPAFNPEFAAGICEWELFIRGEFQSGALSTESAIAATRKLLNAYGGWSRQFASIEIMRPGLAALEARIAAGDRQVLDADFDAAWGAFTRTVHAKDREGAGQAGGGAEP